MLSEKLGGVGTPNNISIINQSTNTNMELGPEKLAKNKIKEGKILKYNTKWKNHIADGPAQYFAKNINLTLHEKVEGKWKPLGQFSFTITKPADKIDDVIINLNDIGRPTIITQFGVDRSFAQDILDARNEYGKFSNITDLINKISKLYNDKDDIAFDRKERLRSNRRIILSKMSSGNLEVRESS